MKPKTYTIQKLRQIAREQGYKLACLENAENDRIKLFNNLKTSITNQLSAINNKLSSDLVPDGVYFICMSSTINGCKTPDRYPVAKGKLKEEELVIMPKPIVLEEQQIKQPNVLSWDAALNYEKKISGLELRIKQLEMQIENSESLEEEIEEEEEIVSPLVKGLKFLADQMPGLTPYLDKHFELKEKQLNLEQMKLEKGANGSKVNTNKRVSIPIGSQEHLTLIESLYNSNKEELLNKELDKLEQANPELYNQVMSRLDFEDEEQEEEEPNNE